MQLGYQDILNDLGLLLVKAMDYHLMRSNPAYNDKGKPDTVKQAKIDEEIQKTFDFLTGHDSKEAELKRIESSKKWYEGLKSFIDKTRQR